MTTVRPSRKTASTVGVRHASSKSPVAAGRKARPEKPAKPGRVPAKARARGPMAKPVNVSRHQTAPMTRPAHEPEPQPDPEEDIHVTHDRKRHHTADPMAAPVSYTRRWRVIMPPALKGSHAILLRQNEMADAEGLDRVRDDDDLDEMRQDKLLVPIPATAGMQIDERLPENRRYCRPWTARFLTALAKAHYARFHTPLQVNSAVRTVEFQERLLLTNGNAAPAAGETASPHLTGQAIDLAKHGLSLTEIAWLRGYLLPLVQAGKVDVEEEFQQACFHISVYKKYVPQPTPKREIAEKHASPATTLAVVMP
jgi:hypothetical protein